MKKHILFFIFLCLIGIGVGTLLGLSDRVGICPPRDYSCIDATEEIVTPFLFLLPLLIIFLILLFTPERAYQAWKKFALIYIPVAVFLIISSPTTGGGSGFGGPSFDFDKELTTWWVSGLFLVISLIIIIVKSIKKPALQS